MPRHSNSRFYDPIIDFGYHLIGVIISLFRSLRSGVDNRRERVLTYFKTTPYGTITTDFLASAAVIGIMVFPVAMGILWIVLTF